MGPGEELREWRQLSGVGALTICIWIALEFAEEEGAEGLGERWLLVFAVSTFCFDADAEDILLGSVSMLKGCRWGLLSS